jgi:hypothetical protein
MKRFYQAILAVLVVALGGCATGYQSSGFSGGFSETQLAPDVFRISFAGNGFTSGERAQDFAMLRAADLSVKHGFTHFAVINEANSMARQTITTPGQSYTTGNVNVVGGRAYYSAQSTYVPGANIDVFKPRSGLLIRCFRGQPKGTYGFDARFLQSSIRAKYRLKS